MTPSVKSLKLTSPFSTGDPFNGLWRYLSVPLLAFVVLPIVALLFRTSPVAVVPGAAD